ncbi:MAG: SEC-C metal-binding domain-containing protein, partial [Comamonas sp.]
VLMTVQVQSNEQLDQATEVLGQRAEHIANVTYTSPTEDGSQTTVRADEAEAAAPMMRVGRNDPCPCGSGLKFKQCHGKLA